jgi:aspartate-semialdehyde dehydrogenase
MKKKVAIIGVTGAVGQEFVLSLKDHPWFEVTQIAASERSAGKSYVDAIRDPDSEIIKWEVGGEIPEYIKTITVKKIDEIDVAELDLVFSAVESNAATSISSNFLKDPLF